MVYCVQIQFALLSSYFFLHSLLQYQIRYTYQIFLCDKAEDDAVDSSQLVLCINHVKHGQHPLYEKNLNNAHAKEHVDQTEEDKQILHPKYYMAPTCQSKGKTELYIFALAADQSVFALTWVVMGILRTLSQTTARTTASCGTTVAGIRHFSTRTHGLLPAQRNTQKQHQRQEAKDQIVTGKN